MVALYTLNGVLMLAFNAEKLFNLDGIKRFQCFSFCGKHYDACMHYIYSLSFKTSVFFSND